MRLSAALLLFLAAGGPATAEHAPGPQSPPLGPSDAAPAVTRAPGPTDAAGAGASVLVVGERLTFAVRYGLVPAGTASLEIKGLRSVDARRAYEVVSTAASNTVFDNIYPVRDRVVSFLEADSLHSLYFEKHLREGKYKADQAVRFDHEKCLATYQDGKAVPITRGSVDVLAAFYRVRTMPLREGEDLYLESHADKKNYSLRVTVTGRETVESIFGPVSCLVVEPTLRSGAFFKNEGRLTIYLTDDERRIPVMMRSKIPVGSISVVLTEMERPGYSGPGSGDPPEDPPEKPPEAGALAPDRSPKKP